MTNLSLKGAKGVIFVYDVCKPSSLKNVEKFIMENKGKLDDDGVKLLLLGNKYDSEKRKISGYVTTL